MKATIYKLGEYKIIESDTGELRWEAHFGFGALREGRCFKKGGILFIGQGENNSPGLLKGEFLDQLNGFPEWLKTKYFCRGFEIYLCNTGKRVTKEEMLLWMMDPGFDEEDILYPEKPGQRSGNTSTRRAAMDVAFKLQRYQIIRKTSGQIIWKTPTGPNTVRSGTCIMVEDILFIGSRRNEQSNLIKRQFLSNLKHLPKWDQTKFYCPKLSLHECKTGNRVQQERKGRSGEKKATETHDAGKGFKNSFEFKSKKADLSGNRTMFFTHWPRKCIICAAGLILLIISLFFAYLIRHGKELKGRWHYKKGKSSSSHHRDH